MFAAVWSTVRGATPWPAGQGAAKAALTASASEISTWRKSTCAAGPVVRSGRVDWGSGERISWSCDYCEWTYRAYIKDTNLAGILAAFD